MTCSYHALTHRVRRGGIHLQEQEPHNQQVNPGHVLSYETLFETQNVFAHIAACCLFISYAAWFTSLCISAHDVES